jgi:hypothetical protein
MEYYENFDQTPEEIAETELIIREDRKELKKLTQKTYKKCEHPPKKTNTNIQKMTLYMFLHPFLIKILQFLKFFWC